MGMLASILDLATVWGLRAFFAYAAWIVANNSFRDSKSPWRSAFVGSAWILGIALAGAVMAGGPICDEMDQCEDGEHASLAERISIALWTIGVLGVPTLFAGLHHKDRFDQT